MDLLNPIFGPLYALFAGVLASASPCALAALPLVVGHMSRNSSSKFTGLATFSLGMTLSLTAVGMVAGALGRSLTISYPWIRQAAGVIFIFAGLSYAGILGSSKGCRIPSRNVWASGPVGGLWMGALYGLSASPCQGPALLSILAVVAASGSVSKGAVLLLAYSLGQTALVIALGLATGRLQSFLGSEKGQDAVAALGKVGGFLVAAVGAYLLIRPYI